MSDDKRRPLVSAEDWAATPAAVQQAFLSLVDMVHTLSAEVTCLGSQVTDLQARLNQTSQTSSKLPSSDLQFAPPRPQKGGRGRPRGGQPSHERHEDPQANTLRAELLRHWDALWTFIRVEGVEPTNTVAERAIRPAIMWRTICFGAHSAAGSRVVERGRPVSRHVVNRGDPSSPF